MANDIGIHNKNPLIAINRYASIVVCHNRQYCNVGCAMP